MSKWEGRLASGSGISDAAVSTVARDILLFNLAKFRGADAVCDRVPAEPGVYAWFQNFLPPDPDSASPQQFAHYLIGQATRQHCLPRTGRLAPVYELELRSRKELSEAKQDGLIQLCSTIEFRRNMATVLKSAMFFQQPLYVGKAANLPSRIRQHLSSSSVLRERLLQVNIEIDRSLLICMPLSSFTTSPLATTDASAQAGSEDDGSDTDQVASNLPAEQVIEDLFSHLFHPLFTARYG